MDTFQNLEKNLRAHLATRQPGIDKLDRLWDAAVLLPIVPTAAAPALLFEVRAQNLKRQPGQICFPGGKAECSDRDFQSTAVRECCEELGLTADAISVAGELDALVNHSGPIIHPFVGFIAQPEKIVASPAEVAEIFTVPLTELLAQTPLEAAIELADHPGADFPFELVPYREKGWRKNKDYYVYFYRYRNYIIWGMTARILYGFLQRGRSLLERILQES